MSAFLLQIGPNRAFPCITALLSVIPLTRKVESIKIYDKTMMSSSNSSSLALQSEYSEKGIKQATISNTDRSPLRQGQSSLLGPVVILWDIENCPVPSDVRPEDVAGNIRMALRVHPVINGAVTMFSAYGDFNAFPRRLREGCQRTGVKLIDVPNGRKDSADKAILVDMFLFALDNPPPSSIMLISGDVDFAPALHILGQRGYTIILVIPAGVGVSSALSNAGRFVWDWPSVSRGEGFVPPAKALVTPRTEISGLVSGCMINDSIDQNDEESIVYRGVSRSCNRREFSMSSQSGSDYRGSPVTIPQKSTTSRPHSYPYGLNDVSTGTLTSVGQNELMWVQPGDLNGLKVQLVKLLELSGGGLPLIRLPTEYQKLYGRPLYVSEYGAMKLVNLLKKMSDAIAVEGKGQKKFVYYRLLKAEPAPICPPVILARRDKKGKDLQEDNNNNVMAGIGSSDEFSDDERVVILENDDKRETAKSDSEKTKCSPTVEQSLDKFKYELQEILVSYSCRIFVGCFEEIYLQRYKKPLDYQTFGVNHLEELLEKMEDVVMLLEEPASKRKFLVAVGG